MNFHNDDSSVNRQDPACGTALRQQTLDFIEGCRIWANAVGQLSGIVYETFVTIIPQGGCSPCVVSGYATSKGSPSLTIYATRNRSKIETALAQRGAAPAHRLQRRD